VSERDASDGGDGAETESDLVARLRAGDEAAYAELVRTQGGRMFAVARRLLRSDDDAADAVQEAFVSAFRAIASFEGGARLSTWLHRIVVNAALMKLRTRARRPEVSIEELLPRRHALWSGSRSTGFRPTTEPCSCCATSKASTRRRRPKCSA